MSEPTVEVHLIGLPVPLRQRSAAHLDELRREFVMLEAAPDSTPKRLLALAREIQQQYRSLLNAPVARINQAADRGEPSVDIVFSLPATAADIARSLRTLLQQADDYCREGGLLTLERDPDVDAYQRWFLDEIVDQLEGAPATPWPDSAPARGLGDT